MDTLLTKQSISIYTDGPTVALRINRSVYQMPYSQVFKVAQGLKVASSEAMRMAGESKDTLQRLTQIEEDPVIPTGYIDKVLVQRYDWTVRFDGEQVYLMLGATEIGFHFTTAVTMATWLRAAGHQAKTWAGDASRQVSGFGILSDAETNYRLNR